MRGPAFHSSKVCEIIWNSGSTYSFHKKVTENGLGPSNYLGDTIEGGGHGNGPSSLEVGVE